ncbi:MAG TPA: FMN-binding protein [Clostridiales bacterium]|nr:FMN-binding protein [Clostridiales bacterium]
MKKGLFVILVLVLSYAILAVGNGMMGGPEVGAGGEAALTGTAQGFGGEVSVTVTMDGDKIAKVEAQGPDETQGIGSNAIEQLPGKIVEANSTDVDAIGGASVTSKAIIEAVNSALESAK